METPRIISALVVTLVIGGSFSVPAYSFDFPREEITKKVAEAAKLGLEAAKKASEAAKKAIEEEIAKKQSKQQEDEAKKQKEAQQQEKERTEEDSRKNFTVNNSAVEIDIEMPEEAVQGLIQITISNYTERVIIPVENRKMKGTIYLRKGQGEYTLAIYYSFENRPNAIFHNLSKYNMRVQNLDTRNMEYLLPSTKIQSDYAQIQMIATELTSGIESSNLKIKKIHDYVAKIVSYNIEGYLNGSYRNDPFDAVSVLSRPKTICSGYANLFAAIARAAGFRARVVSGQANGLRGWEDHAWNEILIEKEWKIVDVTWDDQDILSHQYFLPDETEFSKDHIRQEVLESY